jgi:hypothetical protein
MTQVDTALYLAWVTGQVLQRFVADVHVSEDVEAALLERVHKVDEGAAASRVCHQEKHLRTPELDVRLAGIEQKEVFPHLKFNFRKKS